MKSLTIIKFWFRPAVTRTGRLLMILPPGRKIQQQVVNGDPGAVGGGSVFNRNTVPGRQIDRAETAAGPAEYYQEFIAWQREDEPPTCVAIWLGANRQAGGA